MPANRLSGAATYFQSLFRIVAGFLFLCHGAQKIFGVFGGHKAPMVSYLGLAGIIELIGGTLIILGFFTRPVALVLCGEMAVAYFRAHIPKGFLPIVNGGELAVLYCFFFMWLTFAGAGALSVDALIRKKG
jgi:putative oxidoreductase